MWDTVSLFFFCLLVYLFTMLLLTLKKKLKFIFSVWRAEWRNKKKIHYAKRLQIIYTRYSYFSRLLGYTGSSDWEDWCLMWPHPWCQWKFKFSILFLFTTLSLRKVCCSHVSVLETICRWNDELNLLLIKPDVCKLCCHNTYWPLTFANLTTQHLFLIRAKKHTTHLSTSRSQNAQVSNIK